MLGEMLRLVWCTEIAEFYEESKVERVAILTTHAAHFLNKAQVGS